MAHEASWSSQLACVPVDRSEAEAGMNEARLALDGSFEFNDPNPTLRAHSTPETRERYAFLKAKRLGSTWEEQGNLQDGAMRSV